ncbi:MAG: RIP metalloprotease RseP [Deltaproteobacteria bacterium]|nr:RIP metalloprotease RseP [Deltaproteobacteria bacterium]
MTILAAILFLGILIFVHEAGHFVVAKAFGVGVDVFSFGFGRRLVGFHWRGTDYRLSLIPFGGYVRLRGADPFDEEEGREAVTLPDGRRVDLVSLQSRPVWQRLAIYAAGPAANVILPYFLFVVLLIGGEPQVASVVGSVNGGSPAALAGILPGDEVVEVAGRRVATWIDLEDAWREAGTSGPVVLRVNRDRHDLILAVPPPASVSGSEAAWSAADAGLRLETPSTEIAVLSPGSPAGRAGLVSGDRVVSVDGVPVDGWGSLSAALSAVDDSVALGVVRGDRRLDLVLRRQPAWLPPEAAALLEGSAMERWGLTTATLGVVQVSPDSPAARAGIQAGAVLVAVDGRRMDSWSEILEAVAATAVEGERRARPADVAIFQDGAFRSISVQPDVIKDTDALGRYYHRPILGVVRGGTWAASPTVRVYYAVPDALVRAGRETVSLVTFTLGQIARLVTGEASPKDSLGGPVEIVRQASAAARAGIFDIARLLGMISISVGIFNLLPVPVLDGGHLLFYGIEAIRGRPVSPAFRERAQMVGVMLLVALMLFVFVLDIGRCVVPR